MTVNAVILKAERQEKEILFNLIFWGLYFAYQWFGLAALYGDYDGYFINACVALPYSFLLSFITVHVLLARFNNKGQRLTFWILQVSLTLALLLLRRYINFYWIYPRFFPAALELSFFSAGKWIVDLFNSYLIAGTYALFYFVRSWYEEKQRSQLLLQEKTAAELSALKAQVQPHFIFNTLNAIYSTALQTSPAAARQIGHLSSFLSYNLYEAGQESTSLVAELEHIRQYIELQQARYGQRLDASITVDDKISAVRIAPLLLLPLVENAIKHGVEGTTRNSWIRIDVAQQGGVCSITIENSLEAGAENSASPHQGLGIKNVQKRLHLLYPGAHTFTTMQEPHSYLIRLSFTALL